MSDKRCPTCKNIFHVKPSAMKRRVFCSRKCYAIDQTKRIKEKHPGWKGNKATYNVKHLWNLRHYGKARKCENPLCKSKNQKRFEWANISGKYKRDISDYKQLCPSCHKMMDNKNLCRKKLHRLEGENVFYKKNGERGCKICRKNRIDAARQKAKELNV